MTGRFIVVSFTKWLRTFHHINGTRKGPLRVQECLCASEEVNRTTLNVPRHTTNVSSSNAMSYF
jgi:hypothetical protein